MSTKEIIQNIKQLTFNERINVIEKALKTLQEPEDIQLKRAAQKLLSDYHTDKNLTAFSSLDFENFYETR